MCQLHPDWQCSGVQFMPNDTYDSANMVSFAEKHSDYAHTRCKLLSKRAAEFSYLAGLNTSVHSNQSWTADSEAVQQGTESMQGLDRRLVLRLFTYCQPSISRQSAKCFRLQHQHRSALDHWRQCITACVVKFAGCPT